MNTSEMRVVMFPWLAFGHMTPFLHLANKLAEKNYAVTLLLPNKAIQKLQHFNFYPKLITFYTLNIPSVDGLPVGAETASDIPIDLAHLLASAIDLTRDQVENAIVQMKPNMVLFDAAPWVLEIAKPLGIKAVFYSVVCASVIALLFVPARKVEKDRAVTEAELGVPPVGYPSSEVVLRGHELRSALLISQPFGKGISLHERACALMRGSDAIAIRTCYELEGKFCDYIAKQYQKNVFLTGHVLPETDNYPLEDRWAKWLLQFKQGSVVYCAFGSEAILDKEQFQEIVLGFERTKLPFLLALKPPTGASTVEEALPSGFEKRVKGRGIVWGGWVQQLKILEHPSVGCFVTHCGFGSMWESLTSDCKIVMLPLLYDQVLNARLLSKELEVGVEVVKDENGWVSKENLCTAIKSVMDEDSQVGAIVKKNHMKWKEVFLSNDLVTNYIDKFTHNIQELVM